MTRRKSSDTYISGAVILGSLIVASTEVLGSLRLLTPFSIRVFWIVVILAMLAKVRITRLPAGGTAAIFITAAIGAIAGITFFTALVSPPNSADAMAYHMPRVVYWAQNRSVGFFPTPYLNQIMLQPFAEYAMLHTFLFSAGDHFVNLIQWTGSITSIIGAAAIARVLGAGVRGELIAAALCATLPNGILQSSGAKNDYSLAAWLICAVYFAMRAPEGRRIDIVLAGLALGLAIGTKGTAYIYAPFILLAAALPAWRWWRAHGKSIALILACAFLLNAPQYARNVDLSGSLLGFDSAQADGKYRWRNDSLGLVPTASNLVRNVSEQLGGRSERWNRSVYNAAAGLHRALKMDLNDPGTTWPGTSFAPPRNTNQEADANNRWHLLLAFGCFLFCLVRRSHLTLYFSGLLAAFLGFCFYLKWQPFEARLFLPIFVLACPAMGVLVERLRPQILHGLILLFFFNNARPYLFENWTRPLRGPHSVLRTSRAENYFNDMVQWNNRDSYFAAANALGSCERVGIDIEHLQLEYPLQALLRARNPGIQFVHTAVENPSRKYPTPFSPCAVYCLECGTDTRKFVLYQEVGPPQAFAGFLLFQLK